MYIKYHKWELRVLSGSSFKIFFFLSFSWINAFFLRIMHFLHVKVAMDTQFDFKRNSLGVLFISWIFFLFIYFEWWWGRGLYTVQEIFGDVWWSNFR